MVSACYQHDVVDFSTSFLFFAICVDNHLLAR